MGTFAELFQVLEGLDVEELQDAFISPDQTLTALQTAYDQGDRGTAMAILDAEIQRLRPLRRIAAFDAGTLVAAEPGHALDLPLWLSDLHCRRARLHLEVGALEQARHDLVAAHMLEHVHPNAAPLLVEVYEGLKRFDLAMALLSRLHREDPLSRCYSLLQLVVSARRQEADIAIVRLGIDLITESDRSGLFAAITEVHRQWPGELPDERSLQSLWDEAGGAFDAGDLIKAQATVCRLLAWDPRWVPGWCVLGSLHQRRTKQRRPFDLSGNFLVSELPEDVTALQAAADAFRLAAVLDSALLPAWTGFASASLTLGNLQDAGYAASRAVDIDPGDPETHWLLGSALLAAGDQDGAMRAFDDVIALDPTYQPAVHAVAWVQAHRSRTGSGDHD